MLLTLLVIFLLLSLTGGYWGHSRYGYAGWSPAGIVVLVGVILFLTGHISFR